MSLAMCAAPADTYSHITARSAAGLSTVLVMDLGRWARTCWYSPKQQVQNKHTSKPTCCKHYCVACTFSCQESCAPFLLVPALISRDPQSQLPPQKKPAQDKINCRVRMIEIRRNASMKSL